MREFPAFLYKICDAKIQINGCFPPPTGGGVAEGFPKMKQHEEYARAEVLSLQRKAAELHAKIIKVKMWTNYTPTPTPTYPKIIDNKNLARMVKQHSCFFFFQI